MAKAEGQGERGQTDYQVETVDLGVARAAGATAIVAAGRGVRQIFCQQLSTAGVVSIYLGQGKGAHPIRVMGAGWFIEWRGAPHRDGISAINALQAGLTAEFVVMYDDGGPVGVIRFE